MNVKWKESEKEYVRINCANIKDKDIARHLTLLAGRVVSLHAVRKLRQSMGLKKMQGRGICGMQTANKFAQQDKQTGDPPKGDLE